MNCLYFVARGTLDDVLWKLIEKKFRDLGEFVEGKEKLKLVVDKEYNGAKELQSALFDEVAASGSDDEDGSDDSNIEQELQLDGDLVHDIEELGEEERKMLQQTEETEDNDSDPSPSDLDTKMPAKETVGRSSSQGLTEEDAIALSDDEEEIADKKPSGNSGFVPEKQSAESTQSSTGITSQTAGTVDASTTAAGNTQQADDPTDILTGSRLYRIIFDGTKLGLEVAMYNQRVVVTGVTEERRKQLGDDSKPSAGDILVSIGGQTVPLTEQLDSVLSYLRRELQQPPTELMFLEAPKFTEGLFKQFVARLHAAASKAQRKPAPPPPPPAAAAPPSSSNEVIELLDDD